MAVSGAALDVTSLPSSEVPQYQIRSRVLATTKQVKTKDCNLLTKILAITARFVLIIRTKHKQKPYNTDKILSAYSEHFMLRLWDGQDISFARAAFIPSM